SRDGRRLLASGLVKSLGWGLYVRALDVAKAPWTVWLQTSATENLARFSPDGRFIVYVSDASGREEVYLAPVEGGPESRGGQTPANGGTAPPSSPDGRRIYFRSPEDEVVAVDLDLSLATPAVGAPQALFRVPPSSGVYSRNTFVVGRDGQ